MEVLWGQAVSTVEGSGAFALCGWCPARRSTEPFLFCLAVHPVLKKLARNAVPLAHMDDIYLASYNVERLKEVVLILKDDLEKLNLKVNFSKCRTTRQVPGLDEIAVDKGLKVLGVPLSVDADRGPLDKETGYLIEEIVKLEDTQAALLLLRNVHNATLFSL